ncbi:MAG: hypothetical protein K2Q09_05175 [Phycisphaerales bacterium]|nr:hypothetical protein [Phycisphaerales bacterium]
MSEPDPHVDPARASPRSIIIKRVIAYPVIGVLIAAAAVYAVRFSPSALQQRNMAIARAHNRTLQRLISGDARFAAVEFSDFTGFEGGGSVSGEVANLADAKALEKIVRDSHPPRPVIWNVWLKDQDVEYEWSKPRTIWPGGEDAPSNPQPLP